MSRCVFSSETRQDFRQIGGYIARSSLTRARRVVARLREQCVRLADQPRMGVPRPELGRDVRSFAAPATSYIIYYRPIDDGVEILRVRHGSQRLPESIGD